MVVRTQGDRDTADPARADRRAGCLRDRGRGRGADGRADAAVHSAKDMPSTMPDHLVLGGGAPAGGRARRAGGLRAGRPARPGGLVATGLGRAAGPSWPTCARPGVHRPARQHGAAGGRRRGGEVSAVVVAVAAMERLGWADRLSDVLDPLDVLPQAGQGAIAVQCRADDGDTRRLLHAVDHEPSHRAVRAERAVLAALGGSCAVPGGRLRRGGPVPAAGAADVARPSPDRAPGRRGRAHRGPTDGARRRPRGARGRRGAGAARGRWRGDRGLRVRPAPRTAAP